MPLDRFLGHEQGLRDLTVGVSLSDLAAYAPLRRGQRARPGQLCPRATPRPGMQLGPRALGQGDRTALVSELDRLPVGLGPLAPPSGAAQLGTEVGEGMSQLEAR